MKALQSIAFLCSLASFSLFFSQTSNQDYAPLFSSAMKNTDGKSYTLDELSLSKGIIIVFSCNTCPFVVGNDSFGGWERMYNSLFQMAKEAELGFVLLNANEGKRENEDSFENMKKHAQENAYLMPYLVDKDATIADKLGAKTTPHVYLFDQNKQLVYKGSIDNTWDSGRKEDLNYLKQIIGEISHNSTISTHETEPRGCSIKRKK